MNVTILTPVLRPDMAYETVASVQAAIAFAPATMSVEHRLCYWQGEPDPERQRLAPWLTQLMTECRPSWLVFCDDDTRMHPEFLACLDGTAFLIPSAQAIAFPMAYPEHGGVLWPSLPPVPGRIDGGQVAIWRDYATLEPWRPGPMGDGQYLAALYQRRPDVWGLCDQVVTAHNHQRWAADWEVVDA